MTESIFAISKRYSPGPARLAPGVRATGWSAKFYSIFACDGTIDPVIRYTAHTLGIDPRRIEAGHGCLRPWARQGVLLLNAVLTVVRGHAGSHQGRGWETFTDRVVEAVNRERDNVVFLLWGGYAQKKGAMVVRSRHLVLQSPHPSPLSAHRGFFGCRHFSSTNRYLADHGIEPIDWFDVE